MKMMNKTCIMLAFAFTLNSVTAFAADNSTITKNTAKIVEAIEANENKILTLENAISAAIKNSSKIKKSKISIDNINTSISDVTDDIFANTAANTRPVLESQLKMYEQSKELTQKDLTEQEILISKSVEDYFIAIIKTNKNFESYKASLPIEEQDFKILTLKKELQLLSDKDYATAKLKYENKLADQVTYENNIKDVYRKLNDLMGIAAETRYDLIYDVKYTKLSPIDLDKLVKACYDIDSYTINKKNNIELKRYELETALQRNTNPLTGEINENKISDTYTQREIDQLFLDMQDRENSIRKVIIALNDSIINQEKNYDTKIADLKNMKEQLAVKELQFNLGKITKLDVQKYENSIKMQEMDIEFLVLDHYLDMMKINNPVLILPSVM